MGFGTHAPAGELLRRCTEAALDAAVCDAVRTVEDALQRPGVSFEDFTSTTTATIDIADFYFAPHLSLVRNGQTVSFSNGNAPGGNSHSVSSSDWGGSEPVLPLPFAGFGAGDGFRSGKLGPGEPFTLVADVAALDPVSYLLLPNGDALIGYHCYIHGSAQMNGVLVVQGAAS
jgi:plastocyanin